jgi:hypothetical protein
VPSKGKNIGPFATQAEAWKAGEAAGHVKEVPKGKPKWPSGASVYEDDDIPF